MKGILTKDVEVLRAGGWLLFVLTFVFFALSEIAMQIMGIFLGMYCIMAMLLPDEQMSFVLCLPWKRWQLVVSRFLWVAADAALGILGGITSVLAYQQWEGLRMGIFSFAVLLFGGSVLILLSCCVPRKWRMPVIVAAMPALVTWFIREAVEQAAVWSITGAQLGWMVLGSIVFAGIACGISVWVMEKMEV